MSDTTKSLPFKSSKFRGIRYREHPTRKHGAVKDRYWQLRFMVAGVRVEEGLGWSSQGWTETKVVAELERLREAAKRGNGPSSRKEEREAARAEQEAKAQEAARIERENVSLEQFFRDVYLPKQHDNHKVDIYREEVMFRLYIGPAMGAKPIKDIREIDVSRLMKSMLNPSAKDKRSSRGRGYVIKAAPKSPRTIKYAFDILRQIINLARDNGINVDVVTKEIRKVKPPKRDNRRDRFLEEDEAARLLEALAVKSHTTHDLALLSLHTGMRAGELFALTWGDVAADGVKVRDTKSKTNRTVPLTATARGMLDARRPADARTNDLVFISETGGQIRQVSQTFIKVCDELFNKDVDDPRARIVFHSLRHSFASWLVRRGTPMFVVAKLLGHASTAMTEGRYSHIAQGDMRSAMALLEAASPPSKVVSIQAG